MEANQQCHVVMFPWLAFGHLIPFLELSKSLATRGIRVSFISTPRNIERLPQVPPEISAQLSLVVFLLPPDDGLPENGEATIDYAVVPEWINFHSTVRLRKYEPISLCDALGVPDVTGILGWKRYEAVVEYCDVVLIRSCAEYEGPYIGLLRQILGKPVGLLPPAQVFWEPSATQTNPRWAGWFSWLDAQAPNSVVFVGIGSLAFGLELSGLPFIWVVRNPLGMSDEVDALPEGFCGRIGQRGLICMDWVPQVKILAHPSIGGNLFHSGWGSMIESLKHGLPLILAPMILDQGLNARLAEEKMIGVEIHRDEMDGRFTRDDVAKTLRLVMVEDGGEPLRTKAREMSRIFWNS
ncbi:unnamed protein product [Victoria cruziana]